MNVSPAHGRFHAPPAIDPAPNPREPRDEGESFENVLAAALRPSGEPQPVTLQSDHAACAPMTPVAGVPLAAPPDHLPALQEGTPVAIGEDAVRFDARPVVWRSSLAAPPLEAPSGKPPEPFRSASARSETATFESELQRAIAKAVPRFGGTVSAPVIGKVVALEQIRLAARSGRHATASPIELAVPSRADRGASLRAPTAPPNTSRGAMAEQQMNIALTLLADEVLVSVRGIALSADEEERLGEEMRRLLASSEFGGRTVRVVASGRP